MAPQAWSIGVPTPRLHHAPVAAVCQPESSSTPGVRPRPRNRLLHVHLRPGAASPPSASTSSFRDTPQRRQSSARRAVRYFALSAQRCNGPSLAAALRGSVTAPQRPIPSSRPKPPYRHSDPTVPPYRASGGRRRTRPASECTPTWCFAAFHTTRLMQVVRPADRAERQWAEAGPGGP